MQHKQEQQQQQQQQPQQMGYGGGGLSRFKSAPVSWFDSLLEQTDDEVPSLQIPQQTQTQTQAQPQIQTQTQTHQCVSQLPTLRNSGVYDPTTLFDTCSSSSSFTRHNSSPPELLANLISPPPHTILASDDGGVASNYDILSFLDIPPTSTKVETESDPTQLSQLKGEQSGNFSDMEMEMEMEKLFQDSVPCRVRAKRGFATHPRSIAERVRRTRISDRIRKLQELVPNMDKQTNTADMLEEAVEYVKVLQNQIQELNEHQRNCKCLGRE